MRRTFPGVVLAVVLAAVGALLLTSYVRSAADRAAAGEALVPVLVAAGPVPAGTPAADLAALVTTVEVPAGARAADAVTDLAELAGRRAGTELVAGEQLLASRFLAPGEAGAGIDGDLLQVTVRLDPERAIGGHLATGDRVGVLLSFDPSTGADGSQTASMTHLALHEVHVVRVQHDTSAGAAPAVGTTDGPEIAPTGAFLVTLAVDAPSAAQLVFAAEHGSVWLSHEPAAAPDGGTPVIDLGNVFGGAS